MRLRILPLGALACAFIHGCFNMPVVPSARPGRVTQAPRDLSLALTGASLVADPASATPPGPVRVLGSIKRSYSLGHDREYSMIVQSSPALGVSLRQGFWQKAALPSAFEIFGSAGLLQSEVGIRLAQSVASKTFGSEVFYSVGLNGTLPLFFSDLKGFDSSMNQPEGLALEFGIGIARSLGCYTSSREEMDPWSLAFRVPLDSSRPWFSLALTMVFEDWCVKW